ncbi:MAG: ribbon-helix-helix protein, CopG family [Thermoleophilia bacterium]|nr:ribbon-helix-helix protein, CopG family [Thermoleophilia bacterium]
MATLDSRLEIRLDRPTRDRLERTAAQRGTTVAALAREAIRQLLEEGGVDRELVALEEALTLGTPVPEDPQELARELDRRFE